MPIFELDEGRPRLVQPMQPLAGSFASDCAALLTDHLAAVAGEPLFVVRARSAASEHADVPDLLALDSTGRAVVVDVAQVIDEDAVVAALRHAGAAARMTTTDLARAYHADPSRFPVDFAAFRDQVAFGATSNRREGVRLILLCSEVAAAAGDTLGFLRGPGRSVDVLQLGVVRGADDRRLLDVSPLATHETVRRSVEPTALRLVRSSEAFATAMAYDPGRVTTGPRPIVDAPAAPVPPAPRVPAPPRAAEPPVRVPVASRAASATAMTAVTPVTGVPLGFDGPASSSPPPREAEAADAATSARISRDPRPQAPAPASSARSHALGDPTPPATPSVPPAPAAAPVASGSAGPAAPSFAWQPVGGLVPASLSPSAPAPAPAPVLAAPPAQAAAATASAPTASSVPSSWSAPVPVGYDGPAARHELATLANQRRAATTIVWLRERRNQRLVATLRRDGLVELPDGRVFADPDAAASAAAGAHARVDGWRSWRIGDGGPTLAEAVDSTER